MATMTKWALEPNPLRRRRYAQLLEELGELIAVAARCDIQGIDEVDPHSGKTNRLRLEEEIADVYAQLGVTVDRLGLNRMLICVRTARKVAQMAEWEGLYVDDPEAPC